MHVPVVRIVSGLAAAALLIAATPATKPTLLGFSDASSKTEREWEENLLSAATRRVRSKVSSQQLLIFRLTTPGDLPLTQVAKKLGVSLAQVYLARHRVGKLFKAEVQRLRRETE